MLKLKLLYTFGYMDCEYLFISSSTLLLFNTTFGIHGQTYKYLYQALTIFTLMQNAGNQPAQVRRAQLLTLMLSLDFHNTLYSLMLKYSIEELSISSSTSSNGFNTNVNFTEHFKNENQSALNKFKDFLKEKKKESI